MSKRFPYHFLAGCFVSVLLLFIKPVNVHAVTIQSVADGYWNDPSTWSINGIPQDGDSVFINHQVLATGDTLFLSDFYLNITVTGCLCGERTEIIFDNSELINDGHMAFVTLLLQNNSNGISNAVLLLAQFVKTTSNSSMTITSGGITITPENDLTCHCIMDTTSTDSSGTNDSTASAPIIFDFEYELNLTSDTILVCPGDSIIVNRAPTLNYLWSTGSTEHFIVPTEEGWYVLTLSNKAYEATDSIYVLLRQNFSFLFPNILTPNGDGVNEAIIISETEAEIEDFRVFNRWGRMIYQFNNTEEPDVLHFPANDAQHPNGMYYYISNLIDPCSQIATFQRGWLYLNK